MINFWKQLFYPANMKIILRWIQDLTEGIFIGVVFYWGLLSLMSSYIFQDSRPTNAKNHVELISN